MDGNKVRLDSRGALNYTKKYPLLVAASATLKHRVAWMGEVVLFNKERMPGFDGAELYAQMPAMTPLSAIWRTIQAVTLNG